MREPKPCFPLQQWAAVLCLVFSSAATASQGVFEINHTCASQTGCFAGDTAGYPVTITVAGSYRLTSNLQLSVLIGNSQTDHFIDVQSNNVSIDLAGFEIRCQVVLGGSCGGSGSGIYADSTAEIDGVSVSSGSIVGMAARGIDLLSADRVQVADMRITDCSENGVLIGRGSNVKNVTSFRNGGIGIFVGLGSTVTGSTAFENGSTGIFSNLSATITGNSATGNGGDGIRSSGSATISKNTTGFNDLDGINAGAGSTVDGNSVYRNLGDGIECTSNCAILGNTVYNNGDSVAPTTDDGIDCGTGCLVRANSISESNGFGINIDAGSAYSDNVVSSNGTGQITGTGSSNSRGGNFCSGVGTVSAFCP